MTVKRRTVGFNFLEEPELPAPQRVHEVHEAEDVRAQRPPGIEPGLVHARLAGEVDDFVLDMRFRRADGGVIWIEDFAATIGGDGGAPADQLERPGGAGGYRARHDRLAHPHP